ncbi:hypothetical protein ACFWAT_16165 [Streptomyces syringium]|uniref:hypothetical protein n=1 Tax=Streptomyces syringium TaxID=76729 RepID=UPI003651E893
MNWRPTRATRTPRSGASSATRARSWTPPSRTSSASPSRSSCRAPSTPGPIEAATDPAAPARPSPGAAPAPGGFVPQPAAGGDRYDPVTGTVHRVYPWSAGRPSPWTCYLTDAEWLLEDLRHGHTLDDLPLGKAHFRTRTDGVLLRRLDLRIDFLPLVHISNSIQDGEHFGQSTLAKVMQTLDELAETDTDSARASATTGAPIMAVSPGPA